MTAGNRYDRGFGNVLPESFCARIVYGYLPESIVQPYFSQGLIRHYPLEDPYSSLDVVFIYLVKSVKKIL